MNKRITIAVIAGLVSVLGTMAGSAAQVAPGQNIRHSEPEEFCSEGLGHMRSVSVADIEAIGFNQPIVLVPICEDSIQSRREVVGTLYLDGNVNALRQPMARNDALMAVLQNKDYDEQDVVSLRFGGNHSIILYVHQRDTN